MRTLNTLLERVMIFVANCLFAIFISAILYQVVARNYLMISVNWTDEVALFCFVWSVFFGAAVAFRRGVHYVVEILPHRFITLNNILRLFGSLACLPVIYVLVVHGQIFAEMGWRRSSVALQMPMVYAFAAIPISGVAMALFAIEVIRDDFRRLRTRTPVGRQPEDY